MIIGFTGKKQSGKSTAASFLVDQGYTKHSFADPLRDMANVLLAALGFSEADIKHYYDFKENPILGINTSMRYLLQTMGTEWGRSHIDSDLWVKCEQARLEKLFPEERIVYDDVRFENEAALIRSYGGLIVHVKRPGWQQDDEHVSESGIVVANGDVILDNCSNLGLLLDEVLSLVDWVA